MNSLQSRLNLLLEGYDHNLTLQKYNDKLEIALYARDQFKAKFKFNTGEEVLNYIEKNTKPSYIVPIVNWYCTLNSGLTSLENLGRANAALDYYVKYRNKLTGVNIRQITLLELEKIIENHKPVKQLEQDAVRQQINEFIKYGQSSILYEDNSWLAFRIKSQEAANYFGQRTKWCTTSENGNYWNRYKDSILIIFIKKDITNWIMTTSKWQLSIRKNQFMDCVDKQITPEDFWMLCPIMENILECIDEECEVFNPKIVYDEAAQLIAIRHISIHSIQYMKNPSETVKAAVINSKK